MAYTIQSQVFTQSAPRRNRLQQCAENDAKNIYQGNDPVGDHVTAIHEALFLILPSVDLGDELSSSRYGPLTAAAVVKFKSDGKLNGTGGPILQPWQSTPDPIVGKRTVEALDKELKKRQLGPAPPEPKPVPKPSGAFEFREAKFPLLIKTGADNPANQDLENAPVQRMVAVARARVAVSAIGSGGASVDNCKNKLLLMIGQGGPIATDMAEFFFKNTNLPQNFVREFANGSAMSNQVRGDESFKKAHEQLAGEIQIALQEIADGSPSRPRVVFVEWLQEHDSHRPRRFDQFAVDIDFSFQRSPSRAVKGDPLAFSIGSIQGLDVFITEFNADPSGSYRGKMRYFLWDHFGSNDSDVIDPGQGGLWLLQRKMATGQARTGGFEPYRSKIIVDGVEFSGQLKEGGGTPAKQTLMPARRFLGKRPV
jgi:hypothetical protein